jgi:D-2-hydroxyacid dehydrogenase (NADP+)
MESQSRVRIVVTYLIPSELVERLRAFDERLEVVALGREEALLFWGRPLPPETDVDAVRRRLEAALADAEILYGFIPRGEQLMRLLELAPKLRWFQATSAGIDRLDEAGLLPLLQSQGITITNVSGLHATPIGEYVLGVMLMFVKGAHRFVRAQGRREWLRYMPAELRGKTVGIVGMGAIGTEVARLAKAFGCRVLAVRRSARERRHDCPPADELLPLADLPYLLGESDYVVLATPLTSETRRLIGEAELRAMKPSACIINIARGGVVDEAALVRALKEGWIAGAGLDVFEQEPLPAESELWGLENVIISPHISGGTEIYNLRSHRCRPRLPALAGWRPQGSCHHPALS